MIKAYIYDVYQVNDVTQWLLRYGKLLMVLFAIVMSVVVLYVTVFFKPVYIMESTVQIKQQKYMLALLDANVMLPLTRSIDNFPDIYNILNDKYHLKMHTSGELPKVLTLKINRKNKEEILFSVIGEDHNSLKNFFVNTLEEHNMTRVNDEIPQVQPIEPLTHLFVFILGMIMSILFSVIMTLLYSIYIEKEL